MNFVTSAQFCWILVDQVKGHEVVGSTGGLQSCVFLETYTSGDRELKLYFRYLSFKGPSDIDEHLIRSKYTV